MKTKQYSYSKLDSFKNCPLKYKFTYIDRLKNENESIEAFFGKLIHRCLEWIYSEKIKNKKSYFSLDQLTNKFRDYWDEGWHEHIRLFQFRYPKIFSDFIKKKKMDYYTLGINNLVSYYSNYGPYFNDGAIKIEEKIRFSISNYSFLGIIDRIDKKDLNQIKIIDYKTGRKSITQKKLSANLQMGIYSHAIQSKFPNIDVKDISLSHFYTRNGEEVLINASDIDYIQLNKKITEYIKLIEISEQKNSFESKESNLCNWCYYWKECDKKNSSNPALYLE